MHEENFEKRLTRAAQLIEEADGLIIAAGAGMGIDSGLPDFRGDHGFWKAYPTLAKLKLGFSSIANPYSFETMPDVAWGFYGHRLQLYRETVPHQGFQVLLKLAQQRSNGAFVFTSNVDGQFQKAGFDVHRVIECHGSIHHLQCTTPCCEDIWSAEEFVPVVQLEECRLINAAPLCIHCGALARPNILMFDDFQWIARRSALQGDQKREWLQSMQRPVVIEIGAGKAISTVRDFSKWVVQKQRGHLIRINPDDYTVGREQDVGIGLGALAAISAIEKLLPHT